MNKWLHISSLFKQWCHGFDYLNNIIMIYIYTAPFTASVLQGG